VTSENALKYLNCKYRCIGKPLANVTLLILYVLDRHNYFTSSVISAKSAINFSILGIKNIILSRLGCSIESSTRKVLNESDTFRNFDLLLLSQLRNWTTDIRGRIVDGHIRLLEINKFMIQERTILSHK